LANNIINHLCAGCYVVKAIGSELSVLLVHCKWEDGSEGWVPPKGHLEGNETAEVAALREVAEETGYNDLQIIKPLKDITFDYKIAGEDALHVKVVKWFLAEPISERKLEVSRTATEKEQILEIAWIPLQEALTKIPFKDEQEIVKDIITYYGREVLTGGQSTESVIKIGNTVSRSLNPNSEYVHELLKLLEDKNYKYSPKFLGVENGKEILSFIAGEVGVEGQFTDKALVRIVKMLKEFHDATAGSELADNNEVVCHKDIAPWNTIFNESQPVGFIDFDSVAPGNRVEDLAYFLWTFLQLGSAITVAKQAIRIRLLAECYGYKDSQSLISAVISEQKRILVQRKNLAIKSPNEELRNFSKERVIVIEDEIAWVEKNRRALEF